MKTLEETITELKAELEAAKNSIEALSKANNTFRVLMLTREGEVPAIDEVYLARTKNNWSKAPAETLLAFYEIFEAHSKLFSELILAKKGKDALKAHARAKSEAAMAEVERYRNHQTETKVAKSPEVKTQNSKERKALLSLMKTLKVDEETAAKMLKQMTLHGENRNKD